MRPGDVVKWVCRSPNYNYVWMSSKKNSDDNVRFAPCDDFVMTVLDIEKFLLSDMSTRFDVKVFVPGKGVFYIGIGVSCELFSLPSKSYHVELVKL